MRINVSMRRVGALLVAVVAFLVIAGFCAEYARYIANSKSVVIGYLSLSEENNVPSWWSSLLLFSCSAVLWTITATKSRRAGEFRVHWILLASIFLYLSLDEMVSIHEWLNDIPALRNLHGLVYYGWVIPAGFVVAIFAVSYLRFLFHLPRESRVKVALAGACYVGGALGVELVLGMWTDGHGELNFVWAVIDMAEEGLEIVGSSLFLYALLEYLGRSCPDLTIAIRSGRAGD